MAEALRPKPSKSKVKSKSKHGRDKTSELSHPSASVEVPEECEIQTALQDNNQSIEDKIETECEQIKGEMVDSKTESTDAGHQSDPVEFKQSNKETFVHTLVSDTPPELNSEDLLHKTTFESGNQISAEIQTVQNFDSLLQPTPDSGNQNFDDACNSDQNVSFVSADNQNLKDLDLIDQQETHKIADSDKNRTELNNDNTEISIYPDLNMVHFENYTVPPLVSSPSTTIADSIFITADDKTKSAVINNEEIEKNVVAISQDTLMTKTDSKNIVDENEDNIENQIEITDLSGQDSKPLQIVDNDCLLNQNNFSNMTGTTGESLLPQLESGLTGEELNTENHVVLTNIDTSLNSKNKLDHIQIGVSAVGDLVSEPNTGEDVAKVSSETELVQSSIESNVSGKFEILNHVDLESEDTSVLLENIDQEVVLEQIETQDYASFLPDEQCMFPTQVTSLPAESQSSLSQEVTQERRVHIIKETTCDRFKPMTFEQLQLLYYNPQLVQSTAFIDQFIINEGKKENHEFHEILLNYFRSRKNLLSAEEEVKLLQSKYSQLQEEMWIITTNTITAQGQCGDKAKVSMNHIYEKCEFNEDTLSNMKRTLQTIRDNIVEKISLFAYSSQLSRLQVESYIHLLFLSCPVLRNIPKNAPIQAVFNQKLENIHQVNKLKECISVLFGFHRRPCRDLDFTHNIRKWTDILVAALLRVATFEDHCFILNHVLRSPGGVGQWASKFIQIPAPASSSEGTFGSPVLDHAVVCLATVLLPPRAREEFMCHMKLSVNQDSLNQDATWILVDSDGEEDEDPIHSWLYLHENDIVSIIQQFPISSVFSHILMVRTDSFGSVHYDISQTTEVVMLKIFAFCTCWIDLLGRGLQTYSMARYRQLNKRLGKMIRETVSLVSNHWENYKHVIIQSDLTITRLQAEFDQFFMRATYCILTAQKLGSWQFMTNMPFKCVSSNSMWQLLWILHQGQGQELDLDAIPDVEKCKEYLKDPDSRSQLVDNLMNLQSSETIYLLTTFANMAECRPTTEVDFIQGISLEVFEIAYVCDHTREFCSKVGRELLAIILEEHPYTFSVILQSVRMAMKHIGTMSIYLFRELPLQKSRPTDPDLLVLRQWLLNFDLDTHENQLARLILSQFNWDVDSMSGLILPLRIHRQVALLLVESYKKYISNRVYNWIIGEGIRQMTSVVRQHITSEQKFNNWAWDLALRLKLHFHSITETSHGLANDFQPCCLDEDDWLLPFVKGIKHKNPIACYLGLLMSTKTHNVTEFVANGLDILLLLVEANQFTAVIHIFSCICPYFLSSPAYLTDNERFTKIVQSTLWADETLYKMAKSVIISDFPGNVTVQFTSMIQNEISKKRDMYQSNLMILFWIRAVTRINKWYNDRNCCYLLDNLIQITFTLEGLVPKVEEVIMQCFQSLLKESNQQGMMSSVVSWISSGVYMYQPSLQDKQSSTEFIWLAFIILSVEKRYEMESQLCATLQEELHSNQLQTVDQSLRVALSKLKLHQAPALTRLNIYRWAQQAMDTPYHHTLLPLVWQQFFLLYLGRNVSERSVPHRASVGERFFSSLGHSSMLKKMKKRLSETVDFLYNEVQQATDSHSDEQTPNQNMDQKTLKQNQIELKLNLSKLYETMILWLEESRLHDTNLYLPSLPPQYDATKLLLLFQNLQEPWFQFVDFHQVLEYIDQHGSDWRKRIISKPHRSPTNSQHECKHATDRIVRFLRQEGIMLPAPSLVVVKPAVPDIALPILEDKQALIHLVNSDIAIIKQYASLFENRIDRHCGADVSYIDLLPSLYSNQWKQVLIPIECKSKVNPLHRCSNPAVVQVKIEEREKNEIVQRQIDENRAEYKQMMIEGLLPPPQNVCIAAVHVENTITMLIKITQATTTESKVNHLFDIANTLFYHLASVITMETEFYPPTKQFFSSCIEILGQEFISRDPRQTQQLLQFCLDNPKLSSLTCQHFQPNNSLPVFVPLYEQLIHVLQQQNLDLVFMLLTKFDVWSWLENGKPPADSINRLLSILGSALMSCGAEPDKKSKIVLDLYCSHLQLVLQYGYPSNLMIILNVLLQGSSIERLHVQCWQMVLMICFTYASQSVEEGGRKTSIVFDLEKVESCKDILLSASEVSEILASLSRYFREARTQSNEGALYGLYPAWGRYVPYLSQLLAGFTRGLVTKMLFNLTDIDPYQVLDVVWQQTITVFSPWIEPLWHKNQLISPWHEGDDLVAKEMVFMFKKLVIFIFNEYLEKAPAYSSSVYSLLLMYFISSLAKQGLITHVALTFVTELMDLPWKSLKPDLHLLETMIRVKDTSPEPCFHLIGHVLSQIEWNDIWEYHINHQPPDVACRFQSTLLVLMVQTYGTPVLLLKEDTVKLLVEMEQKEWNFITLSSYRQASNVFLMTAEPKSILAERSNPVSMGIRLMKNAGCFTTQSVGAWSGDRKAKRQMFVHTVTSLLCQCSYLEDVNTDTFKTVIVNLLSDIESVEEAVVDWRNQEEESIDIMKTVLSLLNNCNPEGIWKDMVISTITHWIKSSPRSILLIPCLKAASTNLASISQMTIVMETCIDVIYHPESGCIDWMPVLAAFQMPDNNEERFIIEAVNQGAYLVLQSYLLQKIPFCQSLVDEFKLMELTVCWTEQAKPGSDNESKLLLWWWKLFQLIIYYIDREGSVQECIKLLYRLIAALQILGEDRTSTGLLGAIGLGRKSQLSLQFRITARVIAAFIAAQIISVTDLRLSPRPDPSTTPMAKQTMSALQALKSNKQYSQYKDQCDILCIFLQDEMMCFRQAVSLLGQLINAFYSDKFYLKVIVALDS